MPLCEHILCVAERRAYRVARGSGGASVPNRLCARLTLPVELPEAAVTVTVKLETENPAVVARSSWSRPLRRNAKKR